MPFSSLTTAQRVIFLTITADAQQLGFNLSDYQLAGITIAGTPGQSQTEVNLTFTTPSGSTAINTLTASFGSTFADAGPGTQHYGYSAANWRQNVPTWSMQITSSTIGTIQIDIDPFNPSFGLGPAIGHLGNWGLNTLTGGDTNYGQVDKTPMKRYPNLKKFNCP